MEEQLQLELQPLNKQQQQQLSNGEASGEQVEHVEEQQPQSKQPPQLKLNINTSSNSINDYVATTTEQLPVIPVIQQTCSTPSTPLPQPQPVEPVAGTSRQLFREAANAHGGQESLALLQQEISNIAATQIPKVYSDSSMLDATVSRNPSTKHEKKIGHRRVAEGGEVTYKKIQSKQIMGSIQLGIQHTVGSLASKPKRDLLMNDFWEMETIAFPPEGSSLTPAHHYSDFRFKVYAPIAFRYFRDLFNIEPDDFLMSMVASPMRELSNPGASGSIFYLTDDDEFIIKTVQKKECEFLQKLLPGYYMNLSQNPRTLLPKFFGLYCFHYNSKNVRLVAMNNLLPSDIKMHSKYDLKGSTFRRKASKAERQKASPTFKDLDFAEHHPDGIFLEADTYTALMNTIKRDCMVLESFQIMDYSLLVGIHNLDIAAKEKREERIRNARAKLQRKEGSAAAAPLATVNDDDAPEADQVNQLHAVASYASIPGTSAAGLNRTRSMNRQRLVAHSTAMESITADLDATIEEGDDEPKGGIPARSSNDERLLLYIGIIDILQSYRLEKKLEHTFKSILYNGDTVSVCRPSFYAKRFQDAMGKQVFKKTPTFPLKHSPSKRKTSTTQLRTPLPRTPASNAANVTVNGGGGGRPVNLAMLSGMSTPPPAFDDISEEDITAAVSTTTLQQRSSNSNSNIGNSIEKHRLQSPYSYDSSMRSSSALTSDYSDDESTTGAQITTRHTQHSNGNVVSRQHSGDIDRPNSGSRTLHLTKTSVQVTTVGYVEETPAHMVDVNGKPATVLHATTKTAHIQAPSYTSTLLVNDVPR
ncbi:phosphatidylinositol 4-phosphate 5-kinase type-1 alpha [Drosophila nasuta]|uniref:phosphatidylinositol 4-phosphate 5-kinase type-1 alpha n=1 Tax=Drosophila nasuta TaxID=42062 RepID=UPI00295F51C3|nr:phosphatidylinositol 4-phosphate 5-kinase type-1 alpha [Drosophila nasuta]